MAARARAIATLTSLLLVAAACTNGDSGPTVVETTASSSTSAPDTSATGSATTSSSTVESTTGEFAVDEGLVWTVIGVDFDDTLNVRTEPDPTSDVVAEFEPWATGFPVSTETADIGAGTWRMVETSGGTIGWVNARFLVAQPEDLAPADIDAMLVSTRQFLGWAMSGTGEGPEQWLSERALWVDGVGIYGDGANGPEWVPRADLLRRQDWTAEREFDPPFDDDACDDACVKSMVDYLRLDGLGELYELLVDDVAPEQNRGFVDGALWQAPETLHRIVIDEPSTASKDEDGNTIVNLDWQRIHVVFDWSTGEPGIALLHTWGWTP